MDIKSEITAFIKQNNEILAFINNDHEKDVDSVIPEYLVRLRNSNYNIAFGGKLAILLQLSTDKTIYGQYELKDIRKLLQCLVELNEYDIENYLEAAHFEWAVMDDRVRAIEHVETGLRVAKQKATELEFLLKSINEG